MKHFIIISLLITLNSHAQEGQQQEHNEVSAQNQKRPSWSQGLPERQSPIKPTASMNKYRTNKQPMATTVDDRSLQMTELPSVEIGLVTTKPVIEMEIESAQSAQITRQEAFDQYYSSDKKDEEVDIDAAVNPLIAEYKWTPIKTTPIDIPEGFDNNEGLKLNIQINSKGEVTRVTDTDTAIPKRVFRSAEKSILKWKFQAPSEIGITEDMVKTFSIDIKTET